MGEQTTITLPQDVKDELDEGRSDDWGTHLLQIYRDQPSPTVRIEDDQVSQIAQETANKVLEGLEAYR